MDGYIIEGHVPVAEIERLLAERPDVAGLAVPGMVVEGATDQPYNVIAFGTSGNTELYASYGQ